MMSGKVRTLPASLLGLALLPCGVFGQEIENSGSVSRDSQTRSFVSSAHEHYANNISVVDIQKTSAYAGPGLFVDGVVKSDIAFINGKPASKESLRRDGGFEFKRESGKGYRSSIWPVTAVENDWFQRYVGEPFAAKWILYRLADGHINGSVPIAVKKGEPLVMEHTLSAFPSTVGNIDSWHALSASLLDNWNPIEYVIGCEESSLGINKETTAENSDDTSVHRSDTHDWNDRVLNTHYCFDGDGFSPVVSALADEERKCKNSSNAPTGGSGHVTDSELKKRSRHSASPPDSTDDRLSPTPSPESPAKSDEFGKSYNRQSAGSKQPTGSPTSY